MGALKVRVNGEWVPVSSPTELIPDEVLISNSPPFDASNEIWIDTASDGSGTANPDEIWVGPDDPDVVEPGTARELWYDTDEVPPPGLNLAIGLWDAAVQYTTGDRVLWPADDAQVWGALRDSLGEEPSSGDVMNPEAWEFLAELSGPYLPLSGGQMDAGAKIQFPNEIGRKINLYADTFGLGVSGGTTEVFASSSVKFRKDNPDTGALWADIHGGGMSVVGDALIVGGKNVPRIKTKTFTTVAGTWYRMAQDVGTYAPNCVRWSFGATGGGTSMQAAMGTAIFGNTGGWDAATTVAANTVYGAKNFDSIGSVWQSGRVWLCIRAARAATVTIGYEVDMMQNGNGYAAWDLAAVADPGTVYGSVAL